jgi:hypothetical protein
MSRYHYSRKNSQSRARLSPNFLEDAGVSMASMGALRRRVRASWLKFGARAARPYSRMRARRPRSSPRIHQVVVTRFPMLAPCGGWCYISCERWKGRESFRRKDSRPFCSLRKPLLYTSSHDWPAGQTGVISEESFWRRAAGPYCFSRGMRSDRARVFGNLWHVARREGRRVRGVVLGPQGFAP